MADVKAYNAAVDSLAQTMAAAPQESTAPVRKRRSPQSLTEQARRKAWAERNAAEWKRLKQQGRWA